MPEGLEAEIWRRSAQPLVGRTISAVWCDERVAPAGVEAALVGETIRAVRRRGKVLLVDTDGPSLGLHFGMTGRLVVDGRSPIERLEYASGADRPEWDRLRLDTTSPAGSNPASDPLPDAVRAPASSLASSRARRSAVAGAAGTALRMNDPRRLGRISLDPDLDHLGPDLFTVTVARLRAGLAHRRIAVKTALLDQRVVAGLGNLCADEVLFWAGIDPRRRTDALAGDDLERIVAACRRRLGVMLAAGGSTHGSLSPDVRAAAGACPLDGTPLHRASIDGRTAVWCATHQR
jgi:formamidopyrimidine-DNA glycosylase